MTTAAFRPLAALSKAALYLGLCVGMGGCARACKNDHPYVPNGVDAPLALSTATPTASVSSVAPVTGPDGGAGEPAIVAPPSTTTWRVEGLELAMPGREMVLALVRDFDGDGQKDALAVVRVPVAERKGETPAGELVWFHGAPGALAPPGVIAQGTPIGVQPSCAPSARLERIGPRSAFAEIGTTCTRGAGARAIVVVRLGEPVPAIAFDATVTDPISAPKLSIDVDAADRDKDGIDDVVLRIGIDGAPAPFEPGPHLSARLAFFDRPAGPSRDPDEPEASLRAIATQAGARAAKAKDAATVPLLVQQMRALYRAMCLEGGAPRIGKIHGAGAATCGASKPLEDAGVAEVRALVHQSDALRAFAAAELAQVAPATKVSSRTAEIQSLLAQVAPATAASSSRTLGVTVDAPRGDAPEWGPLAFESNGKLLVRHGRSVSRVDVESGADEPAEIGAWPSQVVSPDGKSRWLEAYHACEGVSLRASFVPTGDGDMKDVLMPVAPRLGKGCGAGNRGEAAPTLPIAWSQRGLEAIVAGQPLLFRVDASQALSLASFLEEAPPLGSPRSPGGKALAIATPRGVLVKRERWALYRAPDFEPYGDLRQCTVTDDGGRLACVKRSKVVAGVFP